jgi:enoyl-CoA hydratase
MGLANRLSAPGGALGDAMALARRVAAFPQICLRSDRASALEQWGLSEAAALAAEVRHGMVPLRSGETRQGAARFASGAGRGGAGV